ncbi:MAG: nitroreductase family deazaflavin-dependent oxidoreductase [Armatimonadetes bacterium]|nr:nitroreductase family deazaflavin-dependent oxidoreductase [Armatimonadota bacterium]
MDLSCIPPQQLRRWFKSFNKFMVLLWRLGLGSYGNGTRYGGYVMVLKHTGRKTGLTRLTPLNFAEVGGDIYCTAGFGQTADWYRNITANPRVEVWLPDSRWSGLAEDVTGRSDRIDLFRRVIIASGFAGPLYGVNEKKSTDAEVEGLLGTYRLVRIRREQTITGRGGPGDLAWVWPLAVLVLLLLLARRRHRNKGEAEGRGRNR